MLLFAEAHSQRDYQINMEKLAEKDEKLPQHVNTSRSSFRTIIRRKQSAGRTSDSVRMDNEEGSAPELERESFINVIINIHSENLFGPGDVVKSCSE